MGEHESEGWADDPAVGRRIHNGLAVVCGLLLLGDLLYHKHTHFDFEQWVGFYPLVGFVSYVGLVTLAKGLRRVVMRREDYYERREEYRR